MHQACNVRAKCEILQDCRADGAHRVTGARLQCARWGARHL